ncbi:hypothetical protein [uncultured Gemmiger sp.]|uniref:hypothetical protein n=1 Tax=uncultured Gemmiger sp. TaxID=1623490 RepID=UPI00262BFE4C|nr:hypothetical protein [uncultured Gemmiger sp.]
MDLKEFHLKSVKESEYHYCFLDSIRKVNYTYNIFSGKDEETENYKFEIYDVEDAIAKFRELCQPDVNFSSEKNVLVLSNNVLPAYSWLRNKRIS